ncbi:MAG: hypothetical protein NAG76_13435 [Candidatus Pristimantibacillus lignocellulolyticus]|uniref:Uncharacterized protein n=1 Tax=Candidatus Pristimantibacillus lignocellulolyticus TaxID=2994561 RepID=A0A9J6Z9G0_9BACL|nr:MAG: hypothetical protein NAG76_13435 [Candidatus Pristimantibacillus lignocellulolyticus]
MNIQGKEYDFYNYPYSENGLNQLVEMVVKLSPIEIELDNKGNVISVGGVVQ